MNMTFLVPKFGGFCHTQGSSQADFAYENRLLLSEFRQTCVFCEPALWTPLRGHGHCTRLGMCYVEKTPGHSDSADTRLCIELSPPTVVAGVPPYLFDFTLRQQAGRRNTLWWWFQTDTPPRLPGGVLNMEQNMPMPDMPSKETGQGKEGKRSKNYLACLCYPDRLLGIYSFSLPSIIPNPYWPAYSDQAHVSDISMFICTFSLWSGSRLPPFLLPYLPNCYRQLSCAIWLPPSGLWLGWQTNWRGGDTFFGAGQQHGLIVGQACWPELVCRS